jgi:hypothetical protein
VFGGTGFLGNRSVRHQRNHEFPVRIASRHPDGGPRQSGPDNPQLQSVEANIHDERSVADVLVGAYGAINPVSLYRERGPETPFFKSGIQKSFQSEPSIQSWLVPSKPTRMPFSEIAQCLSLPFPSSSPGREAIIETQTPHHGLLETR